MKIEEVNVMLPKKPNNNVLNAFEKKLSNRLSREKKSKLSSEGNKKRRF